MGEAREELRHLPMRLGMYNLAWDHGGKSLIYWDNEFLLHFDTTLEVELVLTHLGQFAPFAWTVVAVNQ
jgi:hypothetical protein